MNINKRGFKGFIAVLIALGCFLPACEAELDDEDKAAIAGDSVTEIEYVHLNSADNLFLGSQSQTSAPPLFSFKRTLSVAESSTDVDIGLLTIEASGDVKPVKAKGGQGKKIKTLRRVAKRGASPSKIKAALEVREELSGKIEFHLIDKSDKAHKLRRHPQHSHKIKNAPMFYERDKIYYLDVSADLVELDISQDSTQDDQYQVIRSGVEQAAMDKHGNWMLALSNGQVVHRDASSGIEERMDDHIVGRYDNAETRKFFMAQSEGFLFQGDGSHCGAEVFYKTFLDDVGDLQVTHSQPNNFANCNDTDNTTLCSTLCFYNWYNPHVCSYQAVGEEELLLCDSYVYQLGDVSNDTKAIDFVWAGHFSAISYDDIKIASSSTYLYYYSNSIYDGARLTRIDLDNTACRHLFSRDNTSTCPTIASNIEYIIEQLTATEEDTVRFCGRRLGETQLLLVEILGADMATPEFRETDIESCAQLFNL